MIFSSREPRAYGEATALGSVFLSSSAVLLFFYWKFLSGNKKFTVVTGQGYSTLRVKLGKWRYVAFAGCLLYVTVMMLLPLAFLGHRLVHAPLRLFQHRRAIYLESLAQHAERSDLFGRAEK